MSLDDIVLEYEGNLLKATLAETTRFLDHYGGALAFGSFFLLKHGLDFMSSGHPSWIKEKARIPSELYGTIGSSFASTLLASLGIGAMGAIALEKLRHKDKPALDLVDDALFSHPARNALYTFSSAIFAYAYTHFSLRENLPPLQDLPSEYFLLRTVINPVAIGAFTIPFVEALGIGKRPRIKNSLNFLATTMKSLMTGKDEDYAKTSEYADLNKDPPTYSAYLQAPPQDASLGSKEKAFKDAASRLINPGEHTHPAPFTHFFVKAFLPLVAWRLKSTHDLSKIITSFEYGDYSAIQRLSEFARKTTNPELELSAAVITHDLFNSLRDTPEKFNLARAYGLIGDKKNPEQWAASTEANLFGSALSSILRKTPPRQFKGRTQITREDAYSGDYVIFKPGELEDLQREFALTKRCADVLDIRVAEMLCLLKHGEETYLAMKREKGTSLYDAKDFDLYKQASRSNAQFHNAEFEKEFVVLEGSFVEKIIKRLKQNGVSNASGLKSVQDLEGISQNVLRRDGHAGNYILLPSGEICGIDYTADEMQPRAIDTLKLANQGAFRNEPGQKLLELADVYARECSIDPCEYRREVLSYWLPWAMSSALLEVDGPIGSCEQRATNILNGLWAAKQIGQDDLIAPAKGILEKI